MQAQRTSSHGISPLVVLMLSFRVTRWRYGFLNTRGVVSKGDDG